MAKRFALVGLAMAGLACSDAVEPGTPGIHFIQGGTGTDTIDAQLAWLVIEVRGQDGHVLADAGVEAFGSRTPEGASQVTLGSTGGWSWSGVTDSRGRVGVDVYAAGIPGEAWVLVRSSAAAAEDTARYTVEPGNPTQVELVPADTAVYVGSTFAVRAEARDRRGNAVEEDTPLTLGTSSSSVTVAGAEITATSIGRAAITASMGDAESDLWVSVVPEGRVAAGLDGGIVLFGLDGSDLTTLVPAGSYHNPAGLSWDPEGTAVVFHEEWGYLNGQRLFRVWLDGSIDRVVPVNPGHGEIWADHSADGEWIYYMGYESTGSTIWRVRPDGTDPHIVPGLASTPNHNEGAPSVSPDGTRLAYVRALGGRNDVVAMLDIPAGAIDSTIAGGQTPEWSPDGSRLVLINGDYGWGSGSLSVMDADGTGLRSVGLSGGDYEYGPDWSPDGRWIIAWNSAADRLELIDPDAALALPLAYTSGFRFPAWKP